MVLMGETMKTKMLYLWEIIPYENNPRKNDDAVKAVAESIKQCGYIAPIVVDENNIILAGHTRFKALKMLGKEKISVIQAVGLTEDQKKKYRLLDNKTSEIAEWDLDMLAEELEGLDFDGFDFDWDVLKEMDEVIEDEYEKPVPNQPKSKQGQVYILGRHRLMCGDATSKQDVDVLMNGMKADMLLTDPPYGVNYTGKTKDSLKIKNDDIQDEELENFLFESFSSAVYAMKPGAVFYIWHPELKSHIFRNACQKSGLAVRQALVWVKNSMVIGRQDYQWKHEPCLYGWKDGAKHLWASDRKQTTVLNFDKPSKNKEHPTMKPISLFDYQMKNNTKGGDIVLDLFSGSGTTIMAAEQNGRVAYCMELDPKYVDVIIDRWETFTGEKAVLANEQCGSI